MKFNEERKLTAIFEIDSIPQIRFEEKPESIVMNSECSEIRLTFNECRELGTFLLKYSENPSLEKFVEAQNKGVEL